ncbi:response regulator [Nitrogeniibacter mangrovi]|uniref:Response regulator n=1 Tax=Nitrogeniibacter mangrovi TaxID=2016596 RepID=A0A6C1BA73_9RHOO|nr:response regulator [Nitrogeniibacter mangrovi]QID19588.1 response regulator [Nitrogeniibacter mangrovi]
MASRRVMVVDDVAVIRGFVKSALRDLDVILHEASDGHQGLEMQDTLPADVIICDISMPGMNGEEFLTALRGRGDRTPVIMLTSDGDKAVVNRLLKVGIQGYLLKPFKPGLLADRVEELLRNVSPPAPEDADAA